MISPDYWAQNIVVVEESLAGLWYVAPVYQLFDTTGTLLSCSGVVVDNKCLFSPIWALITLPSYPIALVSEIAPSGSADNLTFNTYLGSVPLGSFTVAGILPSDSYILAALDATQIESTQIYYEPELATVGEWSSEVATFHKPTSGGVTSGFEFSGQSWQAPGTIAPSGQSSTCIYTGETAVNLSWAAPSKPSGKAPFKWSNGGSQQGIIFFPATGGYNYIYSQCD